MPTSLVSEMDAATLRRAGLRVSRHRLDVLRVVRSGGHRHLTPESLHRELADQGARLSLATVYNIVHIFADVGLLRRVGFCDRTFYCTNLAPHHHFYDETSGRIFDIEGEQPKVAGIPPLPPGFTFSGVDVIVRMHRTTDIREQGP